MQMSDNFDNVMFSYLKSTVVFFTFAEEYEVSA